jgi:hypothetical protein
MLYILAALPFGVLGATILAKKYCLSHLKISVWAKGSRRFEYSNYSLPGIPIFCCYYCSIPLEEKK